MIGYKQGDKLYRCGIAKQALVTDEVNKSSAYTGAALCFGISNDHIYFPGATSLVASRSELYSAGNFISMKGRSSPLDTSEGQTYGLGAGFGMGSCQSTDELINTVSNNFGYNNLNRFYNWTALLPDEYQSNPYLAFNNPSYNIAMMQKSVDYHYLLLFYTSAMPAVSDRVSGSNLVLCVKKAIGPVPTSPYQARQTLSGYVFNPNNVNKKMNVTGYVSEYSDSEIKELSGFPLMPYTAYNLSTSANDTFIKVFTGISVVSNNAETMFYGTTAVNEQITFNNGYIQSVTEPKKISTPNGNTYVSAESGASMQSTSEPTLISTFMNVKASNGATAIMGGVINPAFQINSLYSYVYSPAGDTTNTFKVNNFELYRTGGGGGNIATTAYLPGKATKMTLPSKNTVDMATSTYKDYYRYISHKHIPHNFGGALLFSGSNLDNYYKNGSNYSDSKYFFIGLKGLGGNNNDITQIPSYWGFATHTANNYGYKAYKFDDTYFKKIGKNTYLFQDDAITPVYLGQDTDTNGTSHSTRIAAPIGPFFMNVAFSAYRKSPTVGGASTATCNITKENNNLPIPTVLSMMNYITPGSSANYVIAKPTGSLYYDYAGNNGGEANFGRTDDYDYFEYLNPLYACSDVDLTVKITDNTTEITNLGTSMWAAKALYRQTSDINNNIPKLTAIKSNWQYCVNVKNTDNLCRNATGLTSIPSSWVGLNSLTAAHTMFKNCSALETIPSSWEGLNSLTYANSMFENCVSLKKLPNDWTPLSALTDGNELFINCTALTDAGTNWGNIKLTGTSIFKNCTSLTGIPQSWQGFNMTNTTAFFSGCTALEKIPTSWVGFNPATAIQFFMNCKSITAIPNSWNGLSNLEYAPSFFQGCTNIKEIPISWAGFHPNQGFASFFVSAGVERIRSWQDFTYTALYTTFGDCKSLTSIPNSWSGLGSVKEFVNTFENCTKLSTIPSDLYDYCNPLTTITRNMFCGCTALTSDIGPILNKLYNGTYPDTIYSNMFSGCTGIKSGTNTYNQITADMAHSAWNRIIFGLDI